jgi:hypothetical protein
VRCPDETCDCGGVRIDCYTCQGEGEWDGYEDDPLWFLPGEMERCYACNGEGWRTACAKTLDDEDAA